MAAEEQRNSMQWVPIRPRIWRSLSQRRPQPGDSPRHDPHLLRHNSSLLSRIGAAGNSLPEHALPAGWAFDDTNLSWHYHLFGHLSTDPSFAKPGVRILEIGTFEGEFTNFLSKCFPKGQIHTLDLPSTDPLFRETYGRHEDFDRHLRKRDSNLRCANVTFHPSHSSEIPSIFGDTSFDLFWVDGDHHDPQVSNDIDNCVEMMHATSLMLTDDIVTTNFRSDLVSNDSFLKLKRLEALGILDNLFFAKRTTAGQKPAKMKWIAVSALASNRA